jgi:hypothetical protein
LPVAIGAGAAVGPDEGAFLGGVVETDEGLGAADHVGHDPGVLGGVVDGGEVAAHSDGGGAQAVPVAVGETVIAAAGGRIDERAGGDHGRGVGRDGRGGGEEKRGGETTGTGDGH